MSNPSEIFSKIKKQDFYDLLMVAKKYKDDIDVEKLCDDFFGDNVLMPALYERWYKSLDSGNYDYGVYGDDVYITELFNCWKNCTRRTLKDTRSKIVTAYPEVFEDVKNVLDLGCGVAYTTVALSDIFKNANIIGTNLTDTLQYKICCDVVSHYDRCFMIDESDTLNYKDGIDVICAFEFFEHLTNPIELLDDLLSAYSPKVIIFANSFTHMSLGHFKSYNVNGVQLVGYDVNKAFYNALRTHGYIHVKTKAFNNRPQFWIKSELHTTPLF